MKPEVMSVIMPTEVDVNKAVDFILESDYNQRVFNAILLFHLNCRLKDESAIENKDLDIFTIIRSNKKNGHLYDEITLHEIGDLVGEYDLNKLEKTVESFFDLRLISKCLYGSDSPARPREIYTRPSIQPYKEKNSLSRMSFIQYIGTVTDIVRPGIKA
jgi:hypothetical protein